MGKKLANRLGLKFLDLDVIIEEMEVRSIPELYEEIGDAEFRKIEHEALLRVVKSDDTVVSLGGGAPCHYNNMDLLEEHGEVIYLRLDSNTLVSRLKDATKDRPIVKGKSEEELRQYVSDKRERCEHFYQRAKYIVDAKDLTVDRILEVICEKLNS
jgi:shikimate kinase